MDQIFSSVGADVLKLDAMTDDAVEAADVY